MSIKEEIREARKELDKLKKSVIKIEKEKEYLIDEIRNFATTLEDDNPIFSAEEYMDKVFKELDEI